MEDVPTKHWVGTSLEDIYQAHGPWNFVISSIAASRYHSVLYQLPATLKAPPKPHISSQTYHWDNEHVRMPYSAKNLFPLKDINGTEVLKQRWEVIQESLLQPINSSKELEAIINSYNIRLPKFTALHHFFDEVLEYEETQLFFSNLLPGIIRLALQLPDILPGSLPLLKRGSCKSVSLSQLQISSLLANAFLCTFPWRKDIANVYPGVNFTGLFSAYMRPDREEIISEKLKCICHYFRRVLTVEPVGVVTFERKHFPRSHLPRWDTLENNLGNTRMHISSSGVIEDDGHGLLQVDFANKNVGGGVLGFGCVQEEIRYLICPELIISRLFTEQLASTEALIIIGAERYSKYTGYGDTFAWSGNYQDNTPYDSFARRRTSIVAIDALYFENPKEQYNSSCILRELNKAYTGFHSRVEGRLAAVATGNWGCGAFRGDPKLKSLIQLMACTAARRDIVYFTFGDVELRDNIHEMYLFLATNQIIISQLWRYLCRFERANLKSIHLFSYIQQAHFDGRSQTSIKEFFSFNKKKLDKDSPSTSSTNHFSNNSASPSGSGTKVNENTSVNDELNEIIIASSLPENVNIDSDVEIIESSQAEIVKRPLPTVSHHFPTDKITKPDFKHQQKLENNSEDILRLIDIIDGHEPASVKERNNDAMSLLSVIDNLVKTDTTKRKDQLEVNEELEEMEVDQDMRNTSKRKITDYFVKIDKG